MRKRVRRIVRRSQHDGRALWRFFRRGESKRDRLRRARGIVFVAQHRQKAAARRANVANYRLTHADDLDANQKERLRRIRREGWESFEKWGKFRLVYNRQVKRLRQAIEDGQDPEFQWWMLSGHSGNIDPKLKPVIVHLVGEQGQHISDTYDYAGHVRGSYHYPYADPTVPKQGHAVDAYGADMDGAAASCKMKFGANYFAELYSPAPWYIKDGQVYVTGHAFPGHSDHGHYATPR